MSERMKDLDCPSGWNDPPFINHSDLLINRHLQTKNTGYRILNKRLVHPEVSLVNTTMTNKELVAPLPQTESLGISFDDTIVNKAFTFNVFNDAMQKLISLPNKETFEIDELQHKLNLLKNEWDSNMLNIDMKGRIYRLASDISTNNYTSALNIQLALMRLYPLQVNTWLIGIKKL